MDRKRFLQLKMRTKVVREIVNTEESYVRALSLLVEKLYDPLIAKVQSGDPILSLDHIKGIFSHIKGTYIQSFSSIIKIISSITSF
jgi:S-adenosylmethionine synthetase